MPKPKGPDKQMFSVRLTLPALDFHAKQSGGLAIGTHIAARLEREYEESLQGKAVSHVRSTKSDLVLRSGKQPPNPPAQPKSQKRPPPPPPSARLVLPNFKKGAK